MALEKRVDTLKSGSRFREWLLDVLGDRIHDKNCRVAVYKLLPASHTVCRYEFLGEGYSVVAKFYAEPTGWKKDYDPEKALKKEFATLTSVGKLIDIPRTIAIRESFNCALVTEFVKGRSLYRYMKIEEDLYDRLTAVAHTLRRLHDNTKTVYSKELEFGKFHKVLNHLKLDSDTRKIYDRLLGEWWRSDILNVPYGCRIHNDANPTNYIFDGRKLYAIDFESSWEGANFVHDLGIVAAELKHYFAMHRGDGMRAEPYIGHFLWQYSQGLDEFRSITRILPFFIALGLLRIVRLGINPDNSCFILREAMACLNSKG